MPSHALWALPRHISFVYWVDYLSTKKLRHPHFISKHICFVNKETGTARGGRDGLSALPLGVSWISINIWQKIPARGHELLSKLANDETFTLFVLTDGVALRKEAEKANPCPVTSQRDPVLSPAVPLQSAPVNSMGANGSWSLLSRVAYFILDKYCSIINMLDRIAFNSLGCVLLTFPMFGRKCLT